MRKSFYSIYCALVMPTESYYAGMSLAESLREFADHHGKKSTRHITQFEMSMLFDAAELLERLE